MKTNMKKLSNMVFVVTLSTVAGLQSSPVLAKGHIKQTEKVIKCDAKKHQQLKVTKDKKSGKMIRHCIYTGKKVWFPRLVKKRLASQCNGMPKAKKASCLKEEMKKKRARSMMKSRSRSLALRNIKRAFFVGVPKNKGIYVGSSIGQSTLKPKVNTNGGKVIKSTDMAYKIFAGYKINRKFAVEGFYTEMGDAEINSGTKEGKINYRLAGISGLYTHYFKSRFSGFAKLGVAKLGNKVTKGFSLKKVNDYNINMGAGIKYDINRRLSIKGEYEVFDKDIKLLSTGLIAHF